MAKQGGCTCSMKRSVGAKSPLVALAAVKPRVMWGPKAWLASKWEPSPPALMNMSYNKRSRSLQAHCKVSEGSYGSAAQLPNVEAFGSSQGSSVFRVQPDLDYV